MMKNINYILLICALCLGFTACHEDAEVPVTKIEIKNAKAEPEYTSARITCATNQPIVSTCVSVQYSKDANFTTATYKRDMGKSGNMYVYNLTDLQQNTKYYIRFIVGNAITSVQYKEVFSFTTKKMLAPELGNVSVENVADQSATLKCYVAHDGGSNIYQRGFYYREASSSSWNQLNSTSSTSSLFSVSLYSLNPGTTYEVYAYAKNSIGEQNTDIVTFTTLTRVAAPTLTTDPASNIGITSATLGGDVTDDGGEVVTEYGICYAVSSTPTITSGTRVAMGAGTGSFSQTVEGLQASTTYRVRAYAINSIGVSYGSLITFTTNALPDVMTYDPTGITASSASVTGYTSDPCDLRGICYSQSATPTINDYVIESGSGSGSYSTSLSSLQAGTTYYARAFAYFGSEIVYGNTVQFTTLTINPTVQTTNIESITSTAATVNAAVTSDGGQTIIERGVCYSTSGTPTVANAKVTSGVGVGTYSCRLTGLSSSTTYYVRAYAATANGVVYGSKLTFTTN